MGLYCPCLIAGLPCHFLMPVIKTYCMCSLLLDCLRAKGVVMCCCIIMLFPTFVALYRDLSLVLQFRHTESPHLLIWLGPMQHQLGWLGHKILSRQLLPLGPPWRLPIHLLLLVCLQATQVPQCDQFRVVKWFMRMLASSAGAISKGAVPRDQGRNDRALCEVASEAIHCHFRLSVHWPWRACTLCMVHRKIWTISYYNSINECL